MNAATSAVSGISLRAVGAPTPHLLVRQNGEVPTVKRRQWHEVEDPDEHVEADHEAQQHRPESVYGRCLNQRLPAAHDAGDVPDATVLPAGQLVEDAPQARRPEHIAQAADHLLAGLVGGDRAATHCRGRIGALHGHCLGVQKHADSTHLLSVHGRRPGNTRTTKLLATLNGEHQGLPGPTPGLGDQPPRAGLRVLADRDGLPVDGENDVAGP